jgi:hypothetical protein
MSINSDTRCATSGEQLLQDDDRPSGRRRSGQRQEPSEGKPSGADDQDGRQQPDERRVVLEAGGGRGDIARGIMQHQVDAIERDDARQSPGELLERLAQVPV